MDALICAQTALEIIAALANLAIAWLVMDSGVQVRGKMH